MQAHNMKFLCDHMLSRLGKWLRAAGYDTEIIVSSISDHEIKMPAFCRHTQSRVGD